MLPLGSQAPALLLKTGVEPGQALPELVQRTAEKLLGDEQVALHVGRFHAVAALASQDGELAHDVLARQVHARVGLAVPVLLRQAHGAAQRHVGRKGVEHIVERTAQHGLDAQDAVARTAQVVDGVDDGQAGPHVGFEEKLHAALAGGAFQKGIVVVGRRGRNLVGRHDRHVAAQQAQVLGRHLLAGRAVDEYGVEHVHVQYLLHHVFHAAGAAPAHGLAVAGGVDALVAEGGLAAAAHAHQVELQAAFAHERLALGGYLGQQAAAHRAHAAHKEVELLVFAQEEAVVQHVQRLAQQRAVDDKRQVHLQCALCHCRNADAGPPQHGKELARDAGRALHALAHDGHRGQAVEPHGGVHGPVGYLAAKLLVEQAAGAARVVGRHADGRARLRRRLSHHEHADAAVGQRGEDAAVHADDAHHRGARDGHHARFVHRRDAAHGAFVGCGVAADDAAGGRGVERVLDVDGNVFQADGVDRGRIDHLGPEVAQLHGLAVAQLAYGVGRGYDARVGRHEAVHVGPYLQRLGIEGRGDDGRRIVGASAPQVGRDARLGVRGDKAARHGHLVVPRKRLAHAAVALVEIDHGLAALPPRAYDVARVIMAGTVDEGGADERREALAVGHDGVGRLGRQVLDEAHAVEDAFELAEMGRHVGRQGRAPPRRHHALHHVEVACFELLHGAPPRGVAGGSRTRGADEGIRHAAQGRHHHHGRTARTLDNGLYVGYAFGRPDGTAPELHYFHTPYIYYVW